MSSLQQPGVRAAGLKQQQQQQLVRRSIVVKRTRRSMTCVAANAP